MERQPALVVGVRPIATPLPVAFLGLALATTVLSGYETGIVAPGALHSVGWTIVALPVPLQFLAGAWGFVTRSASATTASLLLAATWLAVALASITGAPGPPGPATSLALLLLAAGAAMLVPTLAEIASGGLLPAAVTFVTAIRFFLSGVSGFEHTHAWANAAGYCGFVLAALAIYAALALELEGARRRPVLPVFRTGIARRAFEEGFEEQLSTLEHEPGVRRTV